MANRPVTLSRPECPLELAELATLFRAYEENSGLDLCFQGFEEEVATLPGRYAPPGGDLLLARDGAGVAVACAAFRPLSEGVCELKRLYVDPAARGQKIGELLVRELIRRATAVGYQEMALDSLNTMQSAIKLYRKLGFVERPPYYDNPLPEVVYMSKKLM